jgi:5'-nucleotidase
MTLSIVGTNDFHGAIVPSGGNGGLALFAGYVRNLRAARERDGGGVLLVDGGDMFQGTLESNLGEGTSVVAAYNALGYAAAAVGNHEFDFGPVGPGVTPRTPADDPRGALKARAAEAKFPFLAANLVDAATGRPVEWPNIRPSTAVSVAGITVGIVGVITEEALSTTTAANVRGLTVTPLAAAIAGEASRLRSAGATVVVVAAHAGGRCKSFENPTDLSPCEARAEIVNVARQLPRGRVDVIVAGHSHAGMAHQVEDIAIVESFANGRAFGRVDLTIDRTTKRVTSKRIHPPRSICDREDPATHECTGREPGAQSVASRYEGAPVAADPAIARVLAPAIEQVRELKARPLGVMLETPVRRQNGNESPLGNLVTDALRMGVPGTDVALHNIAGGLRADLPQGQLTFGSVFEVMPFDNRVVQVRVTGAQLKSIFATQLQRGRILGVSGIRVLAECSGTALRITMRRPSGASVADADELAVATIDFLATAGDGLLSPVFPLPGFTVPDAAPLSRDVIVEQLSKRGGTLREESLINPDRPRWTFPGPLPVACRGN